MTNGDELFFSLITNMQICMEAISALKLYGNFADARSLAIAATNLETAMLWVANARKDEN